MDRCLPLRFATSLLTKIKPDYQINLHLYVLVGHVFDDGSKPIGSILEKNGI